MHLNGLQNRIQMNTKDLSGIAIVKKKNEIAKHYWEADNNLSLDQKKIVHPDMFVEES